MVIEYLVRFHQFNVDFRLDELIALSTLFHCDIKFNKAEYSNKSPFLKCNFKNDNDVLKIASRAILIKSISRVHSQADSFVQITHELRKNCDYFLQYQYNSFKITIDSFAGSRSKEDALELINSLSFLPLLGKVDMKKPEVTFVIFEDWEEGTNKVTCRQFWFTTLIATGNRSIIQKYDLKKREYLGITSMDPELSLVMSNQALVKEGSFVLDPFVGTGSFLITCSHFGAFTMGTDIDGRQIRGKSGETSTKDLEKLFGKLSFKVANNEKKQRAKLLKSIDDNVKQYKMEGLVLDTIVCDISHNPWRKVEFWDAIVCDPPYGVRAGAKKIGKQDESMKKERVVPTDEPIIYPNVVPYEMDDVLVDLLEFASLHLVPGGRLVYWMPTVPESYDDKDIPQHPKMRLIANSEQNFGKWARRLITMEKIRNGEKEIDNISERGVPAHSYFRDVYFSKKS